MSTFLYLGWKSEVHKNYLCAYISYVHMYFNVWSPQVESITSGVHSLQVESITSGVHYKWSPSQVESITSGVHYEWSPLQVESITSGVHYKWSVVE